MSDSRLSVEQLEEMLLEASELPGRRALARVTAIRTLLARRPERSPGEEEARAARALELVNATRGPDRQLTEVHPVWVGSILAEPEWAELYVSDEEMSDGR
jgi:hypothetical protein